jgi:hypothetical protein
MKEFIAGLVRTLARFRTWPFTEQRNDSQARGEVIPGGGRCYSQATGAIPEELSHTNSPLRLIALCNFAVPADLVLPLPEPIRLRA